MRGSNDSDSASPAERDARSGVNPTLRYSPEQRELLEHGLRILARLIVRAYFQQAASTPPPEQESRRR